ncbi:MAG: hypothetical protein V2I33_20380, partial [Kangiellaceae bacterium]|nr:hypothetical protein [Kangiellaceae bacterium]
RFPDGVTQEDLDASRLKYSQDESAKIKRDAGTAYVQGLGSLLNAAKGAGLARHQANEAIYQDTEVTDNEVGVDLIRQAFIDYVTNNA